MLNNQLFVKFLGEKMCGRFVVNTDAQAVQDQFNAQLVEALPNSFNIAPTESILSITQSLEGRIAHTMRWGIHPWYNPKQLLINARVESVKTKSAFKQAYAKRRCLIIMNGFFEWQHHLAEKKTVKQPYYIQRQDQQLLAIAAIWEKSRDTEHSHPVCCLLTTKANNVVSLIHDRMPLIVAPPFFDAWLQSLPLNDDLLQDIVAYDHTIALRSYPVTPAVNKSNYKAANTTIPI